MPTAAKLVAAVLFAAIGWLAANAHLPALGQKASVGSFRELTALIGLIVGWRVMGGRVGKGMPEAVGSGILTSAVLVFFSLLLFSTYLMIEKSLTAQPYDGPLDAVLGVFEIMMDQGRKMLTVGVMGVLVLGGMFGGAAAEWARSRWR